MTHYAISDGLLGLVALYGAAILTFWAGKPANLPLSRRLIAAGLFTITLAALTGAARFLTAQHEILKPPHLWLSNMAGIVGSLWILFGLLQLRRSLPIPAQGQYLFPPLIFVFALWVGQVDLAVLLASVLLAVGQLYSLFDLFRQGGVTSAKWMLISLLCLSAVFGTEALFPDMPHYAWHYYHGVMAIWAFALIMAVRSVLNKNSGLAREGN